MRFQLPCLESPCQSLFQLSLYGLSHFILTITHEAGISYYPHYTDEKTEVQRG